MYGNVSAAIWQRLYTCQQQTHVVENRFDPGKLFMQTDLWYNKLKLLNADWKQYPPPHPKPLIIKDVPANKERWGMGCDITV